MLLPPQNFIGEFVRVCQKTKNLWERSDYFRFIQAHSLRKLKWKSGRVDMSLFGKVVRRCCHKIDIDTRNWEHQSRFRWIVSFLPINRKYRGNWLLLLSLFCGCHACAHPSPTQVETNFSTPLWFDRTGKYSEFGHDALRSVRTSWPRAPAGPPTQSIST